MGKLYLFALVCIGRYYIRRRMTTEQQLPGPTFADKSIAPAEELEVGATPPSGGASSSPMYRRILLVVAILVCLVLGVYFKLVIHASVINPAVGCHYFPPGLQLPLQPL